MTANSEQMTDARDRQRLTAVRCLLSALGCLLLSGCLSLEESLLRQEREVHSGAEANA